MGRLCERVWGRRLTPLPLPTFAELLIVREAAFTEPYDQSAWIYRRWVVGRLVQWVEGAAEGDAAALAEGAAALRLLLEDFDVLAQLEEAEPTCKCAWRVAVGEYGGRLHSPKRLHSPTVPPHNRSPPLQGRWKRKPTRAALCSRRPHNAARARWQPRASPRQLRCARARAAAM